MRSARGLGINIGGVLFTLLTGCTGAIGGGSADDQAGDDAVVPDADVSGSPDSEVAPPDAAVPDPGDGVVWMTWPDQQQLGQPAWGADLTDIARHLPASYGTQYWDSDPCTAGHETTHGIQAHLRNYENDTGLRVNAFYVLGDKAALVVEPDIRKADIVPFVPTALRGPRFDLYLVGQTAWDDTPLYIYDEWVAYTNGAEVGVDLVSNDLWTQGWRDAVMGPLEFTAYAIATAAAVADGDPAYFASNAQFKAFTAWNIRRAMALYEQGRVMTDFAWDDQEEYAAALRTGAGAASLRDFARATWGAAWTQEVLGF